MNGPRFTDGRVPDAGIRSLFALEHRWQRWLDVEGALAAAQADVGMVPHASAGAISAAARLERLDVDRIHRGIAETSHPLMALIVELARAAGEPHGGWVHWGVTTQNITQTGDVLVLREAHALLLDLLAHVLDAAADLAEHGADVVLAGRTHGQHAVPITFGFKAAVWIDELSRHVTRLGHAADHAFRAMTGGAAGTFAGLGPDGPTVQAGVARRLGLRPMTVPARSIADPFAEYVCALGILASTSGRIARDVALLMTTEVAEVAEPQPPATVGSSTMPHKRNPQLSQDVIAITAQIRALVPLALEGMLQDHEGDGAGTAIMDDVLARACVLSGDTLTRLVVILGGLELDTDRMRRNLEITDGLVSSEAVMLALGRVIGRQHAHDVVSEAASAAGRDGRRFADALGTDPRVTAHLDATAIAALLDPAHHTGRSSEIAHEGASRARTLAARLRDVDG
jgi:3-carboxy-cis,cis-muconate cycloisomerase